MAKVKPMIGSSIGDAISQKIEEAQKRIETTEFETKKVLELTNSDNMALVDIDKIIEIHYDENNVMHNRSGLTSDVKQKLQELANDIAQIKPNGLLGTGLLQPIIVRKSIVKDGYYERIVGYRRVEGFKLNNEKSIPAVIIVCSDKIARLIRNSENLHRSDLNIFDELYGTLEAIQLFVGFNSIKETKSFLYKALRFEKKDIVFSNEEESNYYTTLEIIKTKTNTKLSTLVDRLSVFNFEDTLKDALMTNKINYTNAVTLSRVKCDEQVKKQLLDFVIEKEPTAIELKDYIKAVVTLPSLENPNLTNFRLVKSMSNNLKQRDLSKLSEDKRIQVDLCLMEIKKQFSSISSIIKDNL
jgi:ParB/RepB/Spo0J family partition protein